MERPTPCDEAAESEPNQPTSVFCFADTCDWFLSAGLACCPHPRACDRRGRCLHPKGKP